MSDEKVESAADVKRMAQDAVPCLGDYGVGCGIEHSSRCPARYRKAVFAAIDTAVEPWQQKYYEAMSIMGEWNNIEKAAAVGENQSLRKENKRLQADIATQRKNVETAEGAAVAMRAELEMFKEMHADVNTISRLLRENNQLLADLATTESENKRLAAEIEDAWTEIAHDYDGEDDLVHFISGYKARIERLEATIAANEERWSN